MIVMVENGSRTVGMALVKFVAIAVVVNVGDLDAVRTEIVKEAIVLENVVETR